MSIVVLYNWCHSDSASVLLYFTVVFFHCNILVPSHVGNLCALQLKVHISGSCGGVVVKL